MLTSLLILGAAVQAGDIPDRPFPPVQTGDAHERIDWTSLQLSVTARSDRAMGAWKDRRMQEQDALDALGPRVRTLATTIPLTPDHDVDDLLSGKASLAARLEEGLQAWRVQETRYHTSGGVEMSAELDLHSWLRPALAGLATEVETRGEPGDATGVVIDARAVPLALAIAPRVSDAQGHVLIDLSLISAEVVRTAPPVQYVTDPADPRAWARAGDQPLFATAADSDDGAWLLKPGDPLSSDPRLRPLVNRGRVVIVVTPE